MTGYLLVTYILATYSLKFDAAYKPLLEDIKTVNISVKHCKTFVGLYGILRVEKSALRM